MVWPWNDDFWDFNIIYFYQFTTWYKESIRSKSELRQNILNEIAGEGKKIYDENEVKVLTDNTKLMQLWIKNNPKKAEDFLRFKDGYDAKNTTERESE